MLLLRSHGFPGIAGSCGKLWEVVRLIPHWNNSVPVCAGGVVSVFPAAIAKVG